MSSRSLAAFITLLAITVFGIAQSPRAGLPAAGAKAVGPAPAVSAAAKWGWRTISLPSVPLTIAADGPTLWVGGLGGMLVRSDDQGATWRVVRRPGGDGLVLGLAFHGLAGAAVGVPNVCLVTKDGGRSWSRIELPGGGQLVALSDADNMIVAYRDHFGLLRHGQWQFQQAVSADPARRRHRAKSKSGASDDIQWVRGVASLGDGRGFAAQLPGRVLVFTMDDGQSWNTLAFPALEPRFLTAFGGRYWIRGEDEKSGALIAIDSADGRSWRSLPVSHPAASCTAQGCALASGNVVSSGWPAGGAPLRFRQTPGGENGASWAIAGDTICEIGAHLVCAPLKDLAAPPPAPAMEMVSVGGSVEAKQCIRCPPPRYPEVARTNAIAGAVVMRVIISQTGAITHLQLLSAPDAALAEAAMNTVATWRYKPTTLNGLPTEVETEITLNFELTP